MKKLLLCIALASVSLAGCTKQEPAKKIIENRSGFDWHDTQITLKPASGGTQRVDAGVVANGDSFTVTVEGGQFSITAKEPNGRRRSTSILSFTDAETVQVNRADFIN